ncbi:MAG: PEP-CTERM sorting domain-containing protein, partial [Myxococcota bacterium]
PFVLDASDVLLFNFSMSTLNNGAEEFFLSGEFAGSDVPGVPPIPEPGTAPLLGLGLLALASRQRRN